MKYQGRRIEKEMPAEEGSLSKKNRGNCRLCMEEFKNKKRKIILLGKRLHKSFHFFIFSLFRMHIISRRHVELLMKITGKIAL